MKGGNFLPNNIVREISKRDFMITKDDYFSMSLKEGVSKRCPILNHCERRADTLAIFNNWNLDESNEMANLQRPIIKTIGEPAGSVGGTNNFHCSGLCPEVSLFETSVCLPPFSNQATRAGYYDKYMNPKYKVTEWGHFTECAEYSIFIHNLKNKNQSGNSIASYIKTHHQWGIGLLVSLISIVIAIIAL